MGKEIIIAIIGGVALIASALIAASSNKKKAIPAITSPVSSFTHSNVAARDINETTFIGDTTKSTITQTGKNNLVIGGDNKAPVHVGDNTYNKPPQRHVTEQDLYMIMKAVPDKTATIKVSSDGSIEGKAYRNEILYSLSKNGYTDLRQITVGMNENYFGKGRLSIRPGQYGKEKWMEILVNPIE